MKNILISVLLVITVLSCSRKKSNNDEVNTDKPAVESSVSIPAYMDAALNGNSDMIKEFIAGGLMIDTTDNNGSTAMMLAAYNGHTEIVKYLLDKGRCGYLNQR